jgi:hypothetical protein
MQWIPFIPRGRIDPNGCQWPPTYSNWFIFGGFPVWQFFPSFRVPDFRGRFEALNNVFRARQSHIENKSDFDDNICSPQIYLSNELSCV